MGIARPQVSQVMTLTIKMLCILVVLSLLGQASPIMARVPARVASMAHEVSQDEPAPGQVVDGPVTRNGSLAPAGEKKPKWSISWTATMTSYKHTIDGAGHEFLYDWKARMAGYAVWREEEGKSWEGFNDPFNMTYTNEYHRLARQPCANGGELGYEIRDWVTDPGRYSSGPDRRPTIDPRRRADGTWYIADPFVTGFNYCSGISCTPRNFTTHHYIRYFYCDGSTSENSSDTEGTGLPFGSVGEIDGDASGDVFTKHIRRVEGDDPLKITTWDVTVRLLADQDLTVERLEVTQGIQDVANTIPLVQGRRTVVRAYLGIGTEDGPVDGVSGVLRGYRGGVLLGEVNPFNPDGVISAYALPDWTDIDDTLNFELPNAWTLNDSLRLEVEVNPGHGIAETNYTNNKGTTDVSFRACNPLSIAYTPIHYAPPGGYNPADPDADIAQGHEFLRRVYPVANNGLAYIPWPGMTWTETMHTGAITNALQASEDLVNRLAQDFVLGFANSDIATYPDRLVGWLPQGAGGQLNGEANAIPGVAAWVGQNKNPNYWRATFAHEVGHTYGLYHNSLNTNGHHWFDVYDRAVKPGASDLAGVELYDFIHTPGLPEPERWVSAESYTHLIDQLCPAAGATETTAIRAQTTATSTLVVAGVLSHTTPAAAFLEPLYRLPTTTTLIPPAGGMYCLKLKNGATLLNQYCFDAHLEIEATTPISPAALSFGLVVPYPAGLNRVELTKGTSTILSARVASAHPPVVTLQFPTAAGLALNGPQTVQWSASDPDGDPLTYSVLYSADGGASWISLGSDIRGKTSYSANFSGLPGGSQSLIKVLASDGFHSAQDVSDNPFAVPNKPPTAAIISPSFGARFNTGSLVVLEGLGADLEEGDMDESALRWTSDRDGSLGAGRLLEATLSRGVHTVTLTVQDSGGLTATDSISVTVLSPGEWRPYRVYLPIIRRP